MARSFSSMYFGLKLKSLVATVSFVLLQSCGDILNIPKHIVGPYYLSESEEQYNFFVCYKLSDGGFVGKTPEHVLEYGYQDSLLIVKVQNKKSITDFYVINMNKDYDVAKEERFRIGPLEETDVKNMVPKYAKITWTLAK